MFWPDKKSGTYKMRLMSELKEKRYIELDALRGIAVFLMVLYHILFDLDYFYRFNFPFVQWQWNLAARSIASLFLVLVGISFVLSWESTKSEMRFKKLIKRSAFILSGAMIISIATWFVAPDAFVKFGILHLIGISALAQPLFARLGTWNLLLGMLIFIAGVWMNSLSTSSVLLFPFGVTYPSFASLDYYPLLPWFGIILLGMGIGYSLYLPNRHASLAIFSRMTYPRWLIWCGRRAFAIYFIHQPVILLLLSLILGRA